MKLQHRIAQGRKAFGPTRIAPTPLRGRLSQREHCFEMTPRLPFEHSLPDVLSDIADGCMPEFDTGFGWRSRKPPGVSDDGAKSQGIEVGVGIVRFFYASITL